MPHAAGNRIVAARTKAARFMVMVMMMFMTFVVMVVMMFMTFMVMVVMMIVTFFTMFMMMSTFRTNLCCLHQFFSKIILTFHYFKKLCPTKLFPRSCHNRTFSINITKKRYCLL